MQDDLRKTARALEKQASDLLRVASEMAQSADILDAIWDIETGLSETEPDPNMISLYRDALPFADRKASEIREITADEAHQLGRTQIELVAAATLIRRNKRDRDRRNLALKVLSLHAQGNEKAYIARRCGTSESNVNRIVKAGFSDLLR